MTRNVALPLVALVFALACGRAGGAILPATARPVDVRIAPIAEEVLSQPIVASGTLGPKEQIDLSFKIGGVVARVGVDAGASVRAGDTLAVLELREIDAAVARAQSAAEKAERDLGRARRLYGDSVATLAQVQDAQTAAEVARADLATAAFNQRYATILAPAAGVVLRRRGEPGELVAPGQPVFVFGSRARGDVVRVGLPDRDAVRVRRGDHAAVRFDAFPDREFSGTVAEIAAAAEPLTGAYTVEVTPHASDALPAGLVGRVEIRTGRGYRGAVVPIESLLEADGDHATVFVLSPDGQHAERRRVQVGFLAGDRVAIASGLERARVAITEGAAYLDDGDPVRVRP